METKYGHMQRFVAWIGGKIHTDHARVVSCWTCKQVLNEEDERKLLEEVLSNPANTCVRVFQCVKEFRYMEELPQDDVELIIE